MKFRLISGTIYELDDVLLDTTFGDLERRLNEGGLLGGGGVQQRITFINAGHTVEHSKTVADESLNNDSTVFIIARPIAPVPTPEPAPVSSPSSPNPSSPAGTDSLPDEHDPVDDNASEHNYSVDYTGAQVRTALVRNSNILFNIIQLIGRENPFFLSYLVINPQLAQEHIDMTLDGDDFKLTIRGEDVTCDPIKPYLMEEGPNRYEIDIRNIEYIVAQTDLVPSEEVMTNAKILYLLKDRDIRATIDAIVST